MTVSPSCCPAYDLLLALIERMDLECMYTNGSALMTLDLTPELLQRLELFGADHEDDGIRESDLSDEFYGGGCALQHPLWPEDAA